MPERAPLILASSSPRRLALLRQVGVIPDRIEAPQIDETPLARELPRAYVLRLAEAKANDVARRSDADDAFVLAADTVVACGRRILARRMTSRPPSAVCACCPDAATGSIPPSRWQRRVAGARCAWRRPWCASSGCTSVTIASYLACDEWRGKAGGYAIQGRAEAFILSINGSYSNVVGLPLAVTLDLLAGLGWRS